MLSFLSTAAALFALVNLLALATPPVPTAPSRLPRLIIHDVAIVNPDSGGRTTTGQTVVIEHDRIVYAGPAHAAAASLPGRRIDGRGKFLIPGLWDAHVHTLRLAPQLQLPLLIANGVTSVRDLGDTCSWSTSLSCVSPAAAWQRAIGNGAMVGPRLQQVVTYHLEEPPAAGAELRNLLQALATRGERMIKLQLDPTIQARDATELAHCDSLLATMRARGTAYVPTHVASTGQDAFFASGPPASANTSRFIPAPQRLARQIIRVAGKVSELEARDLIAYHAAALQLTKRAHDAGVVVLAGSDAVDPEVVHGFSLHEELEYLVRAGLTPAQALAAATTVPARFMQVDSVVGYIAAGQRADLVLLDADPLVDIRNSRRIHTVVFDGRVFGPAERTALLTFVEAQAHRLTIASRFLRGLWYSG